MPDLKNPYNFTFGKFHACAMDSGRVFCWGNGFNESNVFNQPNNTFNQPELVNPRQISAGGWHVCALDDIGVKCWGEDRGQLQVPP